MSGWGVYDWAGAALLALLVLMGLSGLLRRPQSGQSWWSWERLHSAVMIFIGITYLREPGRVMDSAVINVALGCVFLAIAFYFLFIAPRHEALRIQEHDAEVASLAAHAYTYSPQSYQAEVQAMAAQAPMRTTTRARVGTVAIFALVGGAFLALGIAGARQ